MAAAAEVGGAEGGTDCGDEVSVGGEPGETEAAAGDADAGQLSDEADMVDWLGGLDAELAAAGGAGGSGSCDGASAEPVTVLGKRARRSDQHEARVSRRQDVQQRIARAVAGMAGHDAALQAPQVGLLGESLNVTYSIRCVAGI